MQSAIRVQNLSKSYRVNVGRQAARAGDLREAIAQFVKAPLHRLRHGAAHAWHDEEFWALKDLNFEVRPGEVLGIIGKNGSGKSTLLKILSRITFPSSGRAEIRGRVGSLLEVGTGFHHELSGRENIYLNGSLLGMRRREIDRKLDAIVAFSGVDRFLDTPVKRYSSGMRVRLAFAVAAHLEPEILVVDEVLAVGDAAFQEKCLGKMNTAADQGTTVLFVSHDIGAVQALCHRCFLLDAGQIARIGEPAEVVNAYLASNHKETGEFVEFKPDVTRRGNGRVRYTSVRVTNERGQASRVIPMGEGIAVETTFELNGPTVHFPNFIVVFTTTSGLPIVGLSTKITHGSMPPISGSGRLRLTIEKLNLLPGTYTVKLMLNDGVTLLDQIHEAISFKVITSPVYPTGKVPSSRHLVFYPCEWQAEYRSQP